MFSNKILYLSLFVITFLVVLYSFSDLENAESVDPQYYNQRFGYTLNYPSEWDPIRVAENNDGAFLYSDSNGNDIRIYGSHVAMPLSVEDSVEKNLITLKNNIKATEIILHNPASKMQYLVVYTDDDRQITYSATMSEEFYKSNRSKIESIRNSIIIHDYWE